MSYDEAGFDPDESAPWEDDHEVDRDPARIFPAWQPVDLAPILRGENVTPSATVFARSDGVLMLYPARLNSLFGESESLKSWLADIALTQELSADHHVVYVDYEDSPEAVIERLRSLGVTDDQIERLFSYIQPDERFDDLAAVLVDDLVSSRGVPSLVVVDGITEAMAVAGLEPKDGSDVTKFYGSFPRYFARQGSAVLLIDHVTKSTEGRGRWAIGSERKVSGIDGAAYMVEIISPFGRGQTGRVKMTVSKDRCGHVRQHAGANGVVALVELQSSDDGSITYSVEPPKAHDAGAPFRPTFLMERISKAVEENAGIGTRSLRTVVSGKNDAKDLALELLINEGYVRVDNGPNRSKKHVSLKTYRVTEEIEDDDDF